ncbi:hypothetical protein [Methanobacterium sp.]|uniref:hypothetical protein n=1 Tax=Methanobacterium sp. TaxID=2164 RepID=UPI0031590D5C
MVKIPEYKKICSICGEEFIAHRKSTEYCSHKCRSKKYRMKQLKQVSCRGCGNYFYRNHKEDKRFYCSDECKTKNRTDGVRLAHRNYSNKSKQEKGSQNNKETILKEYRQSKFKNCLVIDHDTWEKEFKDVKRLVNAMKIRGKNFK